MAPPAGQRAAIKEDSGADARPVMRGKPHHVEDDRRRPVFAIEKIRAYNMLFITFGAPKGAR